MNLSNLKRAGLRPFFKEQINNNKELSLARITHEFRDSYMAQTEMGEVRCQVIGSSLQEFKEKEDFPVVGDWILLKENPMANFSSIKKILNRVNLIERGSSSFSSSSQKIAANVDNGLIVISLSVEVNLRKIERFITLLNRANVKPVIVLSKSDLAIMNIENQVETLKDSLLINDIVTVSSINSVGVEELDKYICDGQTSIVLGPSGVGKSTLVNSILDSPVQETQNVREGDDKGRHTTVSRSVHLTSKGGVIIDTPGIRGISLSVSEEDVDESFIDVSSLILRCRFNNCSHISEIGCAILDRLDSGELESERWISYLKQQSEARRFKRKVEMKALREDRRNWKKASKNARAQGNFRKKYLGE